MSHRLHYFVTDRRAALRAVAALKAAGYRDAALRTRISFLVLDTGTADPEAESIVVRYVPGAQPVRLPGGRGAAE